jgi:hypothetical protein
VRPIAIVFCAGFCALMSAGAVSANPVVLWYIRDSPVESPNGVWDDQWSGGAVQPAGEIILPQDPGYDPGGCGEVESENSFALIGQGENALRAYLDLGYMHTTQVAGTVTALLSFRQTQTELAFVSVELYRVTDTGGDQEFLCADYAEISTGAWPPTTEFFVLGEIPEMDMSDRMFMVRISSDGEHTELVWDCTAWDGWIQLPEEDPFNTVDVLSWSTIKAMYR